MAAKPPVYFKFTIARDNFPRFRRRWEEATRDALVMAGREGKAEAKSVLREKQKHRGTQETYRSIGYSVGGRVINLTVGTLKGVFVERGTKQRQGPRGRVEAYGFLAAGKRKAIKVLPSVVRARMYRTRV